MADSALGRAVGYFCNITLEMATLMQNGIASEALMLFSTDCI
jgi:hypothetical protein